MPSCRFGGPLSDGLRHRLPLLQRQRIRPRQGNGVTDVIFANNLSAIRGSYQVGKLAGVK